MLWNQQKAFAFDPLQLGRLLPHVEKPVVIHTTLHQLWLLKPIRLLENEYKEVTEHIRGRLEKGLAEFSNGPYSNRYFLVTKKDGKKRFIQDVRQLNGVTIKDVNVPPLLKDLTECLAGYPMYTVLDATSGCNQIPLDKQSQDLTAIWTLLGLVRSTVLPQWATNSVGTFERVMSKVLLNEQGVIYAKRTLTIALFMDLHELKTN